MVTSCSAYGCTYRYKKGSAVGMFRFPTNKVRFQAWVRALKRKNWKPSVGSRICGKHFQTGKPSSDKDHPDYIPNVFTFTAKQNTAQLYEKRKRNLEKKKRNCDVLQEKELNDPAPIPSLLQNRSDPVDVVIDEEAAHAEPDQTALIKSFSIEIENLRREKDQLQQKLIMMDPVKSILLDKQKLLLQTGLREVELFRWLINIVQDDIKPSSLTMENQLLIVLMKLKLNLLSGYIADQFNISRKTVKRIFDQWIPVLGEKLKIFINWPVRKALRKNVPDSFKNTLYKNTVCIIDCTEVPLQRPGNQMARAETWSNYKHSHTIKFLIGATPSGSVSFVSKAWGGRASDKEITLKSGFLDNLCPGDIVLADRGFILNDHFENKGAKLIVPSFTLGRKQLPKEELNFSKEVSNVRIHVERVIRQIKRFRILQTSIPITFLKYIDSVIVICAALSNLSKTIV